MKGVPASKGSPDSIILAGQSATPSWGTGSTGVVTMYPWLSCSICHPATITACACALTHCFIAYRAPVHPQELTTTLPAPISAEA